MVTLSPRRKTWPAGSCDFTACIGNATMRPAPIHQRATSERDRQIADQLSALVEGDWKPAMKRGRKPKRGKPLRLTARQWYKRAGGALRDREHPR